MTQLETVLIKDAHKMANTPRSLSDCRPGHLLARLSTLAADLDARFYLPVPVGDAVAIVGAGGTNLHTFAADLAVMMRTPAHEAGCGRADVGTVLQENLLLSRRMFATKLEAVSGGTVTNVGALVALSSALLKIRVVQMRHELAPSSTGDQLAILRTTLARSFLNGRCAAPTFSS